LAEKAGVTLSKYLIGVIDEALVERSESPRTRISESMLALKEENHKLKEENRIMGLLVEKYENETRHREQATFLDEGFQGERQISSEIVAVLRRGATHDYQLLEALGIGVQDTDNIRAVHKQLEVLELHGMITKDRKGWKWIRK